MANSTLPAGFVKTALQNGVGRYICQLQRITIKFCKSYGSSRGVRDFIESDLVEFARQHPGVVVYLKPRRHRSPCLKAEYLNGHTDYISCHNFTREETFKWLEYMRNKSGYPIVRLLKPMHTDSPSIQGVWTPFTNKDTELNITNFPNEQLSHKPYLEKTATEIFLEMAQRQREGTKDDKDKVPANIVASES